MDNYILIRGNTAWQIAITPPDIVAIPDDASLFSSIDWTALSQAAGGEAALMQQLGVTYAQTD